MVLSRFIEHLKKQHASLEETEVEELERELSERNNNFVVQFYNLSG